MAKKKPTDDALTTSEAPEVAAAPPPPLFFGWFVEPGWPVATVTLVGGGPYDGAYAVPTPLPQVLTHGSAKYDLSDRRAGVYVWKYR